MLLKNTWIDFFARTSLYYFSYGSYNRSRNHRYSTPESIRTFHGTKLSVTHVSQELLIDSIGKLLFATWCIFSNTTTRLLRLLTGIQRTFANWSISTVANWTKLSVTHVGESDKWLDIRKVRRRVHLGGT